MESGVYACVRAAAALCGVRGCPSTTIYFGCLIAMECLFFCSTFRFPPPLKRYEEDPMTGGYGFEAPPAMDSFTAADPYADYELPALDCPYEAPLPESPFDDEVRITYLRWQAGTVHTPPTRHFPCAPQPMPLHLLSPPSQQRGHDRVPC